MRTAVTVADRLRAKARDWELTALAAQEQGETARELVANALAICLFEVAECLDEEAEHEERAA